MQLGFAVAKYPSKHYIDPATLQDIKDSQTRQRTQAAVSRLQQCLDDIALMVLLLHVTHDKILNLSMLNLETMQQETPGADFWKVRGTASVVGHGGR